ncbi:MAG TPA: DUF4160 domain-containing protein [Azospirillaceae bacterium]|nr:DUF4160 domain-containing protein [Azospirillaceae bacterium]
MPTIGRFGPYVIRFFSNEGSEPPHVHVDRGACTAKIWLEDPPRLALSRGFAAHEARIVLALVAEHRGRC